MSRSYRDNELALLRFVHALIGQTIAEVEADTDRKHVIHHMCNRPSSCGGREIGFEAFLSASDESGLRFPIELTVAKIPEQLLWQFGEGGGA